VEGFHRKETVFSVTAVTTRLVGVVGADLSAFPAYAVLPLKSSNASKATATVAMIRRARVSLGIVDPPFKEFFFRYLLQRVDS
jgi:hypothetical protein